MDSDFLKHFREWQVKEVFLKSCSQTMEVIFVKPDEELKDLLNQLNQGKIKETRTIK